jgi:hypothetical protein
VLLIEEKIGVGFAIVYPNKCVARGENCLRHAQQNRNVRNTLFITRRPGIENSMVPLAFSRDQES